MAQTPEIPPELAALIRRSAAARACLTQEFAVLRHRLDVPARVRDSLRTQPAKWLGGSLVAGLGAMLLFRRPAKSPAKRRGLPGLAGSLLVAALRPLLKSWLTGQLKHILASRLLTPHPETSHDGNSGFSFRP